MQLPLLIGWLPQACKFNRWWLMCDCITHKGGTLGQDCRAGWQARAGAGADGWYLLRPQTDTPLWSYAQRPLDRQVLLSHPPA